MHQEAPNIEEVFFAALEIESQEARSAFLDQACGDPELRRRVERLLARDAQSSGFLEAPAAPPTVTVESPSLPEGPSTVIGPYKLREQIGEGGMGVVYVAEQTQPVRRKVALKIIKPGMDTRQVIARFEAERQALAMMDHPNIAKVHDGGTTESGRPYFVMELVRGIPITDYCDREQLAITERLELFVQVCRAVQHAHQKGVIHRDLKPSNILITLHDGVPVPKVIDFGIAKATGQGLTEKTIYTEFAQLVGTPLYMSPEQAELSGLDIDTRSDIYSLGVLLYELLTGTTPFDAETLKRAAFDEMRRIIREEEPPKPSIRLSSLGAARATVAANRKADARQLDRSVHGELDWIVMKALEKDRRRRYETANDFASDMIHYLTDQPVDACPPSAWYRFRKFASRNRSSLATTTVLVVSGLTLGCVLLAVQLQNVSRVRKLGEDVRQALAGARTAIEAGDLGLAERRMAEAQARLGGERASLPDLTATADALAREIHDRQAEEARFQRFLKLTSDAEDKMTTGGFSQREPMGREALDLYGVLAENNWLTRLDNAYLTLTQRQQVRETAYITLLALADCVLRSRGQNPQSVRDSLDLLGRAEVFHPPTRAFYYLRSECHRRVGNNAAADQDVKRFKAAKARTAWDYFLPGRSQSFQGNPDEAIRSYRAALALQPDHYNSLYGLAWCFSNEKISRRPEAIQLFTACIALRPKDWIPYANRASCYEALGELDDAINDRQQVARLLPDFAFNHYDLGIALWKKGRWDEAIASLQEAIRLYPEFPGSYYALALFLATCPDPKLRDPARADELARKAAGLPRQAPYILNALAWDTATFSYPSVREPARAVELARKAVELAPQDRQYRNTLGVAHYRAGDWKASVASLEKSMELANGGDSFDWFFLAMAHRKLGHNGEARAWYDKAVGWMAKNKPQDVELIRFRAEAAGLLGVMKDSPADVFARP
jgi:serine/threonine protein kinase/tetratricopeptide (TPR) repeat protein